MTTTNRAVDASWNVLTSADKTERAHSRELDRTFMRIEDQRFYFPRCMAEEYAAEAARHPQVAASLQRHLAEAKAAERALAAEMDVTVAELREISREAYEFGHSVAGFDMNIWEHRVMATVSVVGEAEKDVRKGVWYWGPSRCECAKCAPITVPVAPPRRDFPSKLEMFGEPGADW